MVLQECRYFPAGGRVDVRWYWWTIVGVASGGVLGVSYWALRKSRPAGTDGPDDPGGGEVTTGLHELNDEKWVDADPQGLADASGYSLDEYALASAAQSEDPSAAGSVGIMWTVVNHCNALKTGIGKLLTTQMRKGVRGSGDGHFGAEATGGRYCSTAKPPTATMLEQARDILSDSPTIGDPTGGATFWDGPHTQNVMHAKDPVKYTQDWPTRKARLMAKGLEPVEIPGVPAMQTTFWRKATA